MSGKSKGCFYNTPYLDDYGETDHFLKYVLHYLVSFFKFYECYILCRFGTGEATRFT